MRIGVLCVFISACSVNLRVPAGAQIGCQKTSDCPSGLVCEQVRLVCVDPESPATPGVRVAVVGAPRTSETGAASSVSISLLARPSANVTFTLAINDETEGAISEKTVTFRPENWSEPQNVLVSGQPDCLRDGDKDFVVSIGEAISDDAAYQGMDPDDLVFTNTDDRAGSIAVSTPASLQTSESGAAVVFAVQLGCAPTGDVLLPLRVEPASEAIVSPSVLRITKDNWQQNQLITVTGISDCQVDGDQAFQLVVDPAQSEDSGYVGLDPGDVTLTNLDTSEIALVVSAPAGTTDESGTLAPFSVRLPCQPNATVTVSAAVSNANEGMLRESAGGCVTSGNGLGATCNLTFDSNNWDTFQEVEVKGVEDAIDDGTFTHELSLTSSSSNAAYNGIVHKVPLFNTDNDTAGVQQSTTSISTSEDGSTGAFILSLLSQPTADVVVELGANAQGSYPASITLNASNWQTGVTVTVGSNNNTGIGPNPSFNIPMTVRSDCADPKYAGRTFIPVTVTHQDNDKYIFVTSLVNGAMGGLTGADSLCNAVPPTYPAGRVWKALLGTSVRSNADPSNWVMRRQATYWRIGDGVGSGTTAVEVGTAHDQAYWTFPLQATLYAPGNECVWTGIDFTGPPTSQGSNYRCGEWTSSENTAFGTHGDPTLTTNAAVTGGARFCSLTCRVLCMEQ